MAGALAGAPMSPVRYRELPAGTLATLGEVLTTRARAAAGRAPEEIGDDEAPGSLGEAGNTPWNVARSRPTISSACRSAASALFAVASSSSPRAPETCRFSRSASCSWRWRSRAIDPSRLSSSDARPHVRRPSAAICDAPAASLRLSAERDGIWRASRQHAISTAALSESSGSAGTWFASTMTPWISRPAAMGQATACAQPAAANAAGPISSDRAVDTMTALTIARAWTASCATNQLGSASGRRWIQGRRCSGSARWATSRHRAVLQDERRPARVAGRAEQEVQGVGGDAVLAAAAEGAGQREQRVELRGGAGGGVERLVAGAAHGPPGCRARSVTEEPQ